MRGTGKWAVAGLLVFASLLAVPVAEAGPYLTQGPFVSPWPSDLIPGTQQVPGKEFSDNPDKDATQPPAGPNLDPEQVIAWDGAGGIMDTFDYSGSRIAEGDSEDRQVDALANLGDALYQAVTSNLSALLFSVQGYGNIYYEDIYGGYGTWATPPVIDQDGVSDVDGLEVWGPEGSDDANRYSLIGDPAPAVGASRISVWAYNPPSAPYITAAQIAAAIVHEELESEIDLDAMMIYDIGGDDTFGLGDSIMFSIAPISYVGGAFDGGEIWVWTSGGLASFLNHGGHLWDTAFDVKGTFGLTGNYAENVNALEAVSYIPEPVSLIFFGTGIVGVAGFVARRRTLRRCARHRIEAHDSGNG